MSQTGRTAADRMADAFAAEEWKGVRLAFRLRLIALALTAMFLRILTPGLEVLYTYALLLGFVVIGLLSLIRDPARSAPSPARWTRWLLPFADLALVTFAVIQPNPFGREEWLTLPLRLGLDNALWLLLFVALATLTYSPRQVLWTGISAAICWTAATLWIGNLPGVAFAFRFGQGWEALPPEQQAVAVSSYFAHGVSGTLLAKQMFVLLVVSGILAAAVQRSRSLVLRQARIEGERAQLARYFSANMVEQLADADRPLGEVHTETVAVLFADIVGFTGLSETQAPEQVIGMLREFHARMQAVVFAHQGTLDKYLGDGLMATFGTPRPGPRDAANALAAVRDMADALQAWNLTRQRLGAAPIRIGIGLHWGPVVLGDIGGDNRLEFATIGDTVNVASRLEHMTRELDAEIVASAAVVVAAKAAIPHAESERLLAGFERAPPRPVRGRSAELEIFVRRRMALSDPPRSDLASAN
ncbi:MAG TPA: adenylate/guanylate cyclase domain-containing protein [Xanthobacteraceae bacterium]|nr:adenylate/guanylate cyclase domain-containing protein [Xanthobacteraceae bacterium]